jgi:hypothetical protein
MITDYKAIRVSDGFSVSGYLFDQVANQASDIQWIEGL